MATITREPGTDFETRRETVAEATYERWNSWPVNWSGIWVGTLATLAAVLVLGLIGIAVGAHLLRPEERIVDLKKIQIGALIFSVCAAFFAFVLGGWVAGKVAGILRSEPGMLHGAIVWLVTVPVLLFFGVLGAGSLFGGWYAGLAGNPSWAAPATTPYERPDALLPGASAEAQAKFEKAMEDYHNNVHKWKEETPKATRNSALGAVTALLLGLVGSVLGGWWASGEPMNFTHFRTRNLHSPRTVRI